MVELLCILLKRFQTEIFYLIFTVYSQKLQLSKKEMATSPRRLHET